jgi:hypothetical protein
MSSTTEIKVKVDSDFFLDMGTAALIEEEESLYIVHPPTVQLFDQLVRWLDSFPRKYETFNHWKFGIGATAICLRWGTWLAVLFAEDKPVDPAAKAGGISMISDSEMKRINIEASANLARLLEIWHDDERRFYDLVFKAYSRLPMPHRWVKKDLKHAALVRYPVDKYSEIHALEPNFFGKLDPTGCEKQP